MEYQLVLSWLDEAERVEYALTTSISIAAMDMVFLIQLCVVFHK